MAERANGRAARTGEEYRALMKNPAARKVWDLLAERYPQRHLTPDTSMGRDLGVDSIGWVGLKMEIGEKAGLEMEEEAIDRADTVRDLLREATKAGEAGYQASPVEEPEEVLDEAQKRWLEPLGPAASVASRGVFALNRAVFRGAFRLRAEGMEHLPGEGSQFVMAPNHSTYIDPFVVAAALDYRLMRRTWWAGSRKMAFGNPVFRSFVRLARAVPVEPDQAAMSSLAFGAAVLERGNNLAWFPEGRRSLSGELLEFKSGIGLLLDRFRVPVVPVITRGAYEVLPPGKLVPRPKKITVHFGRPLFAEDLERQGEGEKPRDRIASALRDHMVGMSRS